MSEEQGRRRGRRGPWLNWMLLGTALLAAVILAVLASRDDEAEVATEREDVPETTPTALAALPGGVEETALTVQGGAFAVNELVLQEGEPTELDVVNGDGVPYRLRIGDLITPTPIDANGVTVVKFTTPIASTYEGQLLAAEGDEVLDTLRVVIRSPGGVAS